MIAKWKSILTNWINCYPIEPTENPRNISIESLLSIITYLRQNFCLDESKSSVLQAYTIEEFISEKYPDFKFNSRPEELSEDELCTVASLLLLFVCVNSKDITIKTAMCSKLSADDQKLILKFSQNLMNCSVITNIQVENAILECCGQEIAGCEARSKVSETPPALRSLHSEVRRLQAALDAERFDRNYLQEELARTQQRIDNLAKEKAQFKSEILNLKAKVSNCCGQEAEAKGDSNTGTVNKLLKQIDELEERLADTISKLDEAIYEREAYKNKVNELKVERDKWFNFSQQETSRAGQLAEQLLIEQRNVESLRELVAELRQHYKCNGLDGSQLECDDLDASLRSLGHNASICNEACVNVVEVQLAEEKAKVLELNTQIQNLEEKLNELKQNADCEKNSLQNVIDGKENDIVNLKHRINEEIEEKDNLNSYYKNEISQLTNEIGELEHKIRNETDNFSLTLNNKMHEIKTLQEEKLSLLLSLSDETTKLEGIITARENTIENLRTNLASEKNSKQTLKADYENNIMKLKDKILNRNNELVELQNNILQKSEIIEKLHFDVRNEKDSKEQLTKEFEHKIDQLDNEIQKLNVETKQKESYINDMLKEREEIKMSLSKEIKILKNNLDTAEKHLISECNGRDATITSLKTQLQDEIKYKMNLQAELTTLKQEKDFLNEEFDKLKSEYSSLNKQLNEKIKMVDTLDLCVEEQKNNNVKLRQECENLKEVKIEMDQALIQINNELQNEKRLIEKYTTEMKEKDDVIKSRSDELVELMSQVDDLNKVIQSISEEKLRINDLLTVRSNEIISLRDENNNKIQTITDNYTAVIEELKVKYKDSEDNFKKQQSKHNTRLNETERILKESRLKVKKSIEEKDNEIVQLKSKLREMEAYNKSLEKSKTEYEIANRSLNEESVKMKKEYEQKSIVFNNVIDQFKSEIANKENCILKLNQESNEIKVELKNKSKEIKVLEEAIDNYKQNIEKMKGEFESEKLALKDFIIKSESDLNNHKETLNKAIAFLKEALTIETDKHKATIKEKDSAFNNVLKELSDVKKCNAMLETKLCKLIQEKDDCLVNLNELETIKTVLEKELLQSKNAITVTELMIEEQKSELQNVIHKHNVAIETLSDENKILKDTLENEKQEKKSVVQDKENVSAELNDVKNNTILLEIELRKLKQERAECIEKFKALTKLKNELEKNLEKSNERIKSLQNELQVKEDQKVILEKTINEKESLQKEVQDLKVALENGNQKYLEMSNEKDIVLENVMKELNDVINKKVELENNLHKLQEEKDSCSEKLEFNLMEKAKMDESLKELNIEIESLNEKLRQQRDAQEKIIADFESERLVLQNMITVTESVMEDQKIAYEKSIDDLAKANEILNVETKALRNNIESESQQYELALKDIQNVNTELSDVVNSKMQLENEIRKIKQESKENLSQLQSEKDKLVIKSQKSEEEILSLKEQIKKQNQNKAVLSKEVESQKLTFINTIAKVKSALKDHKIMLGKVIGKNKMNNENVEIENNSDNKNNVNIDHHVTDETLVNEIFTLINTFETETKNIEKNEEIADLKKQLAKLSATENRASQIIIVSSKYQAIILKRIAEIKSNTVLKELTNFGNSANGDNEIRRSIAGNVTMEDLENFLETTDRHLKRCSEKQILLQKERDRLSEVNRINESEIINMKKFLTELSVSIKTFASVREVYTQKLSRVVSIQRTVRREIHNLDGHITDAAMYKLERNYNAVMQDLAECVMNMERWVERFISRTVSAERIKQAFTSEMDRVSMSSASLQNTSLEVQLDELENSFKKILEDASRALRTEANDSQSVTVMEVRAEYEDKLNRMKSKMKQLYQEQITLFREKQKEEISVLERELQKTREKMVETSQAYEEHIKALTTELWSVGEKFLMKKDEAEWLRKRQSGSLQSLQHINSAGLLPREAPHRPSDTYSLKSLPVQPKKSEARGLHMSDEEGEVFDNRHLPALDTSPRSSLRSPLMSVPAPAPAPAARLSELRWRNSLCPPHLKSSYPAETQFVNAVPEDHIKCVDSTGGKQQRKEVGIIAYKKPGPPTPSKQAGRLSATDSELHELRAEPEPAAGRKTSTPSRLRALFRSVRNETTEGTPRSGGLSFFRSKK